MGCSNDKRIAQDSNPAWGELLAREYLDKKHIGKVSVTLRNQRDDLLAFARMPDGKLGSVAQPHALPIYPMR